MRSRLLCGFSHNSVQRLFILGLLRTTTEDCIAYPHGIRAKHSRPSESIRTSEDWKCRTWKMFKGYVITLQATSAIRLVKKITKRKRLTRRSIWRQNGKKRKRTENNACRVSIYMHGPIIYYGRTIWLKIDKLNIMPCGSLWDFLDTAGPARLLAKKRQAEERS